MGGIDSISCLLIFHDILGVHLGKNSTQCKAWVQIRSESTVTGLEGRIFQQFIAVAIVVVKRDTDVFNAAVILLISIILLSQYHVFNIRLFVSSQPVS